LLEVTVQEVKVYKLWLAAYNVHKKPAVTRTMNMIYYTYQSTSI